MNARVLNSACVLPPTPRPWHESLARRSAARAEGFTRRICAIAMLPLLGLYADVCENVRKRGQAYAFIEHIRVA